MKMENLLKARNVETTFLGSKFLESAWATIETFSKLVESLSRNVETIGCTHINLINK